MNRCLGLLLSAGMFWGGGSAFAQTSSTDTFPARREALSSDFDHRLEESRQELREEGFRPWIWQASTCTNCPLRIQILNPRLETSKVEAFIRALETHRDELLRLYGSDPQEYNLLARMAVGILGRESEFFQSPRYLLKENAQPVIELLKVIRVYLEGGRSRPSANSRGPTQIKVVPSKIAATYHVTPDTLYQPEHAALATMGYLIEALAELKRRVVLNHLTFVNPATYVDYLPYIYFGSRGQLVSKSATPSRNIYIQQMKTYMTWVELYEKSSPVPPTEDVPTAQLPEYLMRGDIWNHGPL